MKKRGLNKNNKKGLEYVFSIWVVMIISVIVLIFLVLFFSQASRNFLDNIKAYFSRTNVDMVTKNCNILYDSMLKYEFCCEKKEVKYLEEDYIKSKKFTCFELINQSFISEEIKNGINCQEIYCNEK